MIEILEGLRGPVLGFVFVIFALAGIITTAAFAALIAQMGLLLRLRPRETQTQQTCTRAIRPRTLASSPVYRSPKASVKESSTE